MINLNSGLFWARGYAVDNFIEHRVLTIGGLGIMEMSFNLIGG